MIVELGPGTAPRHGVTIGIDLHHPIGSPPQNAAETPWKIHGHGGTIPDSSIDEVYASHFMEHIHRGQPLINVMNEAWRVLKPGGCFTMIMPLVGYTDPHTGAPMSDQIGWQPWSDPTHVNYWWFPEALYYFCEGAFAPNADYGTKVWSPMGPWVKEESIDKYLRNTELGSFWGVRGGWEGCARLVHP